MKYKVLALVLCLAMLLTMTLPGTLAMPVDAENATSDTSSETGEVGKGEQNILPATLGEEEKQEEEKQEETPAVNPEPVENPEEKGEEKPAEGNSEEKGEEKPEEKPEAGDAPEGETPENPGEEKECTCESVDGVHAEGCPAYQTLFERLMACEDFDTISEMLESLTDEEFASMTQEQLIQVFDRKYELEPEPLPAIILEETEDVIVPSIIVRETVNFTNVAPLCSASEG